MWDWSDSQYAEMREKFNHAFEYDETSVSFLRWKNPQAHNCKPGDVAGNLHPNGYWRVRFESKSYKVHHVIWIMHGNKIPESLTVDHDDRKRANNNINNLGLLDDNGQNWNQERYKDRKYKGVCWNKEKKKWQASIKINGKLQHIGRYKTEIEAAAAWNKVAAEHGRTDLNVLE